jgi:hypothetical protein
MTNLTNVSQADGEEEFASQPATEASQTDPKTLAILADKVEKLSDDVERQNKEIERQTKEIDRQRDTVSNMQAIVFLGFLILLVMVAAMITTLQASK